MASIDKKYRSAFIKQQDESDCGPACLASLVKYFGGEVYLERVRELSGTNKQGTSLLGLYQAAAELGMEGEAYDSASLKDLQEIEMPCILHVEKDEGSRHHFIVYYKYDGDGNYLINDPEIGVTWMPAKELDTMWKSNALMTVQKTTAFKAKESLQKERLSLVKQLLKDDINLLSMVLVLGVGITILGMATAVFSQKLIDDILPNNETAKLMAGLGLLLFLLIVRGGLNYVRQLFLVTQSQDFNNRIINHFYGSLMYLPKSFFDNRKIGELVARMNDTSRIQSALAYITANLLIDVLLVLVAAAFIFSYSVYLGIASLMVIPVYFLLVFLFHDSIVRSQRELMVSYASNESNYVDTIDGIGEIKVANKEELFTNITKHIYGIFQSSVFNLGRVRIRFTFATEIVGTIIIVAVLSWSSYLVLQEVLLIGEMMAILQFIGMMLPAAGRMATINIQLQEARVAFDRMFEFTMIHPEYVKEEDDRKEPLHEFSDLKVDKLSFRYPGHPELLKELSVEVKKGELITIMGESGSGKSTALQILQGFYKHENGSLLVNGIDWSKLSMKQWRGLLAVVPQDVKIFNGNLMDNICLGEPPDNMDQTVAYFDELGFARFFDAFPQGYLTLLGEAGINISGGQQQLVALARALYKKPQLLLLDEPTAAMDRNTEKFILELLQSLKTDMGVVLVTHRLISARKADRIYVLEDGVISAAGSHEELIQGDNLYSKSWKDYE